MEQNVEIKALSPETLVVCLAALDDKKAQIEQILRYSMMADQNNLANPVVIAAEADRSRIQKARSEIQSILCNRSCGDY